MAKRELRWRGSDSVKNYYCGACDWSKVMDYDGTEQELRAAFENHVCGEKKSRREDFSQAAARIVREATDKA